MNIISETKLFSKTLIFFFAFGFIFPTFRVLLIGHETSASIFEYFISSLPELIAFVIAAYTTQQLLKSKEKIRFTILDWIILAFIVSNVLFGFILAKNLKLSLYGFRMSYFPMIFYFIVRFYDFKDDAIKKTLHLIFLPVVVLAIAGHVLYFGMPDVMIEMISKSGGRVNEYFIIRMTSLCWTPVLFGTFVTSGFLYFYYRAIEHDKWINYLFMAFLWSGAVLSVARGAIVALIIGFILLSFISFRLKPFIKTFAVMAVVLVILAFYINSPSEFVKWFWGSSVETVELKKGVTRVDWWTHAFENFRVRPLGHGLGMAGHVGARFLASSTEDPSVFSTDGWFLKVANETGIWGLLSYLIISITYFICFVKKIRKNKNLLMVFLIVFFIVFNIQNLVSNTFDFPIFSYLFWLMIGIAVNLYYKTEFGKQP